LSWEKKKPRLELLLSDKDVPSELDPPNQLVDAELAPWPIGGVRWFLLCPQCGRRCSKLYAKKAPGEFCCRMCGRLSYASAQRWNSVKRNDLASRTQRQETIRPAWENAP
jgi:hypothetical protein